MPSRNRRVVVPAVMAVALSAGVGYAYSRAAAVEQAIGTSLAAQPGLVRIPLDRPGTVTSRMTQAAGTHPHGVDIFLELGDDDLPDAPHRLEGLRGSVSVTAGTGDKAAYWTLGEHLRPATEGGRRYWLGRAPPVPDGGFSMTVEVEDGAAALTGVDSTVFGRYLACELELLPSLFWLLVAGLTAIPAVVCWVVVGVRAVRLYCGRG